MNTTKRKCEWNDGLPNGRQRLINKQNSGSRLLQLPEDIIRHILLLLPAKSASRLSCVSKQLEGSWKAWCSFPVIDLNDDDGDIALNLLLRYLKFRRCHLPVPPLEKFRLRIGMMSSTCFYLESSIEKLLFSFALESCCIKELDLISNLPTGPRPWDYDEKGLSLNALVSVKSLTSLSLESLMIKNDVTSRCAVLLPSLKTLSLKSVRLNGYVLNDLISKYPSIQYMSLIDCSGEWPRFLSCELVIARSRTLKKLEIKGCSLTHISVHECEDLESVTISTGERRVKVDLKACGNLKYINLSSQFVPDEVKLDIEGCNDCAKLTVNIPDTCRFVLNGNVVGTMQEYKASS